MYCKVLTLKPDQKEVTADIILNRAAICTVKVHDADGKPFKAVLGAGTTSRDWMHATRSKGEECLTYGLDEGKPRLVVFSDEKGKFAGSVRLTGKEKEPVIATLAATATIKGKLVDPDRKPISNVRVLLGYADRAADEIDEAIRGGRNSDDPVTTNAAGEFTIDRVIPNMKLLIDGRNDCGFLEHPDRKTAQRIEVKPGESIDVGAITLKLPDGE